MMGRKSSNTKKNVSRKNKIHVVFDADARRDFLSGFHKRKLQRKKKAEEEMKQQFREEKKKLKLEAREKYRKLVESHLPSSTLQEELLSEEMHLENHCVSINELSTAEISLENKWIGQNQAQHVSSPGSSSFDKNDEPGTSSLTKKDLKKVLKKQAQSNIKKSRPIQRQMQMESRKMKKKSLRKNVINKSRKPKTKRKK